MSNTFRHSQVAIGESSLHVVELGAKNNQPYLFLHGWPESWLEWQEVMTLCTRDGGYAVALDLPGVGSSQDTGSKGSKRKLAATVHQLAEHLGLGAFTLVGHDAGGMVAYAYLREYRDVASVVIIDTAVPGVDPWDRVLANPYIWHFAFHAVPKLPESLVQGHQAEYFAYFYDAIAAKPTAIRPEARAAYAEAYGSEASLRAGFELYRAFAEDARDNRAFAERGSTQTPLLYVRGGAGYSAIGMDDYAAGLRGAGVERLSTAVVPDVGHFIPEEAPAALWSLVKASSS